MKCPRCGLINPDSALRCDCGYDFSSGESGKSYRDDKGNFKPVSLRKLIVIDKDHLITPLLVLANVLVLVVLAFFGVNPLMPSPEGLARFGGNIRYLTLSGQYWRLLTSVFIHAGVLHLVFNMYALLNIGYILEEHLGKMNYLVCYLIFGIGAGMASLSWNERVVSVGASGAIFGLFGFYLMQLLFKRFKLPAEMNRSLLSSTVMFIVFNLVFGLTNRFIDNAAHVGGLLAGISVGFIVKSAGADRSKILGFLAGISIVIAGAFLILKDSIPDNIGEYERVLKTVFKNENTALWIYRENKIDLTKKLSEEDMRKVKTRGIDLWNENIGKLKALTDLPDALQKNVDLLIRYSTLRRESYESIYEFYKTGDRNKIYNVVEKNREIDAMLKKLAEENEK